MNLFGWLKRDPESKGMAPGRAVVIPHAPNVETISNSVENNSSADSVSTLGVTVRLLKPGESAQSVGSQYPRLPTTGLIRTSPLPEGCQRLHVNVPNWIHLMVRQERYIHRIHADIPVWVDPAKDRIWRIDKEKLIEEMEPLRNQAIELWERYGMTGGDPSMQTFSAEGDLGGLIGGLLGKVSEVAHEASNIAQAHSQSKSDFLKPDMSKHPPVEGVDFNKWVEISVALTKNRVAPQNYSQFAESLGAPAGRWEEIDKVWNQRKMTDWKLGTLFGSEYEAAMKRK
ncbi:MAG: hypothetical protein H7Y17_09010 [Chlorobia bacterium]|nr:hypothetical protein [Fimbriimonadaceae bacterium]